MFEKPTLASGEMRHCVQCPPSTHVKDWTWSSNPSTGAVETGRSSSHLVNFGLSERLSQSLDEEQLRKITSIKL